MDNANHVTGNQLEQCLSHASLIQCLPEVMVEAILGYLCYEEVARAAEVCQLFQHAAANLLRTAMRKLVPKIEAQMKVLEQEVVNLNGTCIQQQMHIALLHSVLRVVLADAHMVRAVCWRYIRDGTNCFCFPAGNILDKFKSVLNLVRDRQMNKDLEPEVTTELFLLIENFIDIFDSSIEPWTFHHNTTPYGIKILDILDCCQCSNYHITVAHGESNQPFFLSAFYELRDVSTIDTPPLITSDMANEIKLMTICRYIRNNVRWNNLFHPLKELWDLEDAVEQQGTNDISGTLLYHHDLHKRVIASLYPSVHDQNYRKTHNHIRKSIANKHIPIHRDEFTRELHHFNNRLGLTCDIQLHGSSKQQLPLDLEFLNETLSRNDYSTSCRELGELDLNTVNHQKEIPKDQEIGSSLLQEPNCSKCDSPETQGIREVSDGKVPPKETISSSKHMTLGLSHSFLNCGTDNITGLKWLDNPTAQEESYNFKMSLKVIYPTTLGNEFLKETTITVEHSENTTLVSSNMDFISL